MNPIRDPNDSLTNNPDTPARSSRALPSLILHNLPRMAIIAVDLELHCLFADGVFLRNLGWNPVEMLNKPLVAVLDETQQPFVLPHFQKALEGYESSLERTTPNYSYQARYVPLRNEQNELFAAMAVLEDIGNMTDREAAERQGAQLAIERERIALIGRFIEQVGQYLRTPLAVINSSAYLLSKAATPEKSAEHLNRIFERVALLERIVSGTLKFVELQGGKAFNFGVVDINDVLSSVLNRLPVPATGTQVIIETTLAPALPSVQADSEALGYAIKELLINATQNSPTSASVQVRTRLEASQIVIEVEDHGMGISQDDLPHIFEPLFRGSQSRISSETSIGLGLSNAQQIVTGHGGKLDVKSSPGQGSLFTVYLPTSAPTLSL